MRFIWEPAVLFVLFSARRLVSVLFATTISSPVQVSRCPAYNDRRTYFRERSGNGRHRAGRAGRSSVSGHHDRAACCGRPAGCDAAGRCRRHPARLVATLAAVEPALRPGAAGPPSDPIPRHRLTCRPMDIVAVAIHGVAAGNGGLPSHLLYRRLPDARLSGWQPFRAGDAASGRLSARAQRPPEWR